MAWAKREIGSVGSLVDGIFPASYFAKCRQCPDHCLSSQAPPSGIEHQGVYGH